MKRSLPVLTLVSCPLLVSLLAGCDAGASRRIEQSGSLLAALQRPTPIDAAQDMVDPYSPDKRLRGTLLISNAPFGGEDVYTKIYEDHLQTDSDSGVRAVSALALGRHGSARHAPMIAPLLKDKEPRVRQAACRALQRLHNPEVVEALLPLTRLPEPGKNVSGETDKDVRADACTALGQYAEPRVLQALIAATDDDELIVSAAAAQSLGTLTGQDLGEDRVAWTQWAKDTKAPFAGRRAYEYPYFARDKYFWEYIPFVEQPPNERPGTPAGMPGQAEG